MNPTPDQPENDDVEGHMPRVRIMDTEAATEEDTEGHGFRGNLDTEAATEDDTEGHRIKFKMDSEAATEDDDTEGHRFKFK